MGRLETVVFGGGCFWCTEAVFKMLKGVKSVESGYAGSPQSDKAPTYEQVSSGSTGYAEVIKIEYDQSEIKFGDLLTVFFASHDPTTLNQQGNDFGTQYRSIILFSIEEQKEEAIKFIEELNDSNQMGDKIVTEVQPLIKFYPAEEYHKDYYKSHPENQYCQLVINPKLEKVQKKFVQLLKK